MRIIGAVVGAALILFALRMALGVAIVGFVCLIVWGALFRPRETYGFIGFCVAGNLIRAYPLCCLTLMAAVLIACIANAAPTE